MRNWLSIGFVLIKKRGVPYTGFLLKSISIDRSLQGLEAGRWCEGYIAAMLVSLQVPRKSDCLPIIDLAPFLYGN